MKELINNLRDYAELAQASYFNFMYINNDEREMDSYKIGQNRFPKDKDNIENLEYTKTLSKNIKIILFMMIPLHYIRHLMENLGDSS